MSRRERKKEETRSNIITCAIELFKEKSFQETSMEEIAEKSDVSKGTLYNYFQDKEAILIGYFQLFISNLGNTLRLNITEASGIEARLGVLLDFVKDIFGTDVELTSIYFKSRMAGFFAANPLDSSTRSGLEKYVLSIIEEAQSHKELRSDIPALVMVRNFQFLTMSFFISNIYKKEPFDMESVKNQIINLFLNGAKL